MCMMGVDLCAKFSRYGYRPPRDGDAIMLVALETNLSLFWCLRRLAVLDRVAGALETGSRDLSLIEDLNGERYLTYCHRLAWVIPTTWNTCIFF